MSHLPAPLPQANRTLHSYAAYKTTLDIGAFGNALNSTVLLFTTAPHLGYFFPVGVYVHSDTLASATIPTVEIGFTSQSTQATTTADFCASQTISVSYPRQFNALTLAATTAASGRGAPPSTPIYLRRGALAGISSSTAVFNTPATIGGSVTVAVNSSNNYAPIATYSGSTVYVWASGYLFPDVYILTALPTTTSMTIQLQTLGSGTLGGAVPIGTSLVNPAGITVTVAGYYTLADPGVIL